MPDAAQHVREARRQLDLYGAAGAEAARDHLEQAVSQLRPLAPESVAMDRWRCSISSHLLAARNVSAAGLPVEAVVRLLRQATDDLAIQPA